MKVDIIYFTSYLEAMNGEGPILEAVHKIAEDDFRLRWRLFGWGIQKYVKRLKIY